MIRWVMRGGGEKGAWSLMKNEMLEKKRKGRSNGIYSTLINGWIKRCLSQAIG